MKERVKKKIEKMEEREKDGDVKEESLLFFSFIFYCSLSFLFFSFFSFLFLFLSLSLSC